MIYQRAALREFAHTAAAVFVALFAILLTTQTIRLLSQAADGKILSEAVFVLIAFAAIKYLPVLLSLALFLSVLMTVSRWYRDSEMIIWLSSGLSLSAWIKPVLIFATPILLGIALISLVLAPWAALQNDVYRVKMDQRDDVARVSPGAFNESVAADRVFFVENVAGKDGSVQNVFISSVQHGRLGVMATARGHVETAPNGDRFLVLDDGMRHEGVLGTPEYRVMAFERYAVRIEAKEARGLEDSPRTKMPWELLRQPTPPNLGELLWRLGIPFAAFNLALLAIPLGYVNPRAGRANHLVYALLVYMIYNNALSVSQAWVSNGSLQFAVGLVAVHAAVLLVLLVLFHWRSFPLQWRRFVWR